MIVSFGVAKRSRRIVRHVLMVAGLVTLAGCASPDTTFFTLATVPGTPAQTLPPGAPRVVELRRPGVPGYLDRSDIVLRDVDYRLQLAHFQSWGEPLGDLIGSVLAQDLSQRLPGMSVFTETGAISVAWDARADINIQQFSAGPDGVVRLVAQLALQGSGSHETLALHRISLAVTPGGPTTAAMVAAMSAALGQLADQVAAVLLSATQTPVATADPAAPSS